MPSLELPVGLATFAGRAADLLDQVAGGRTPDTLTDDERHLAARCVARVEEWVRCAALLDAPGDEDSLPDAEAWRAFRVTLEVLKERPGTDPRDALRMLLDNVRGAFSAAGRPAQGLEDARHFFARMAAAGATEADCFLDRAELLRQCGLVRRRLAEYDPERYDAAGPRLLLRLADRVLSLFEDRLRTAPGELPGGERHETARRLEELAFHLALLDGLDTSRMPWAIVNLAERRTRALSSALGALLLAPRPAWRYAPLAGELCARWRAVFADVVSAPGLEAHFRELPPALLIVQFPEIERDNVLLHALLGREIGRLVAERYLREAGPTPRRALLDTARKQKDTDGNPLDRAIRCADRMIRLERAWTGAVRELVSAAVGARLYGPAALLALARTAEAANGERALNGDDAGPPWPLVLHCALAQLDRAALRRTLAGTALGEALERVAALARGFCDAAASVDGAVRPAYALLADEWPALEAYLDREGLRGQWEADPAAFLRRVTVLAGRLALRVPPNADESDPRRPAAARDVEVITACWLAWLESRCRAGEDDDAEAADVLARLGMKALDDLELCGAGTP